MRQFGRGRRLKPNKNSGKAALAQTLPQFPPAGVLDSRPVGPKDEQVEEWLRTLKSKPDFKGQFANLKKHVSAAQKIFESGTPKAKFGLDDKIASRLTIRNLSTTIAVAQFTAA